MQRADISIFETIQNNQGGNLAVVNSRPIRNVGMMAGAVSLVSTLPTLSKIGQLTQSDKFQDVAKKVSSTAKNLVSAGAATASTMLGYPATPEEMTLPLNAAQEMLPDRFMRAGEKVFGITDKALDILGDKLKSDRSMIGPLVLSVLLAKGLLSTGQVESILMHQSSDMFLPFLCSSARAGLSFNAASKLFSEILK